MRTVHVTSVDVARLRCPYCGRAIASDAGWITAGQRTWGACGVSLTEGGERVATILLAPSADGQDAAVMAIWVDQAHVRRGVGKRLIQATCAGLRGRGVSRLVARAGRAPTCEAPPREFLRRCGFTYVRRERLWLLDLDTTVTDRPTALDVIRQLAASLRPVGHAEPAARADGPRPAHTGPSARVTG